MVEQRLHVVVSHRVRCEPGKTGEMQIGFEGLARVERCGAFPGCDRLG